MRWGKHSCVTANWSKNVWQTCTRTHQYKWRQTAKGVKQITNEIFCLSKDNLNQWVGVRMAFFLINYSLSSIYCCLNLGTLNMDEEAYHGGHSF